MNTRQFVIGALMMVMGVGVSLAQAQEPQQTPVAEERVNINFATLDELKALPGIDPDTAQAIIANRPYKKIADLLKVKGMTQERLKKIRERIVARKLNLNSAKLKELLVLPEIDRDIAEKIIQNRPYKMVEELLKIQGFGEARFAKIRDLIDAKPADQKDDERGWKTRKKIYIRRTSDTTEESVEPEE